MPTKIKPIWNKETVYIIGGGASLPKEFGVPQDVIDKVHAKELTPAAYSPYMRSLYRKKVIGINAAYTLGKWIDILFFCDSKFWKSHRDGLTAHPATIYTVNSKFEYTPVQGINHIHRDRKCRFGLTKDTSMVSWNNSSGGCAISLAAHLGAKKIILLGFDMNDNGGSHFHKEYDWLTAPAPFHKFMRPFTQIRKDADSRGIEIINASMESSLNCFPKIAVADLFPSVKKRIEK